MITLAVPSKGRMRADALALLDRAGLGVRDGDERSYRAASRLDGVEVAFMSASEIAREVVSGGIAMGVTGLDLVWESADESPSEAAERTEFGAARLRKRLGFGQADVVLAVPSVWFDVASMDDLADVAAQFRARHGRRLRVATKYERLSNHHLTRAHGIQAFRIVSSLGATEGAPHGGLADVIVDITSTGSTLRANDLKVPAGGLILRSEACLFATDEAEEIARRIAGAAAKPSS